MVRLHVWQPDGGGWQVCTGDDDCDPCALGDRPWSDEQMPYMSEAQYLAYDAAMTAYLQTAYDAAVVARLPYE